MQCIGVVYRYALGPDLFCPWNVMAFPLEKSGGRQPERTSEFSSTHASIYSVFESFEDNAAWYEHPALACQTAQSRNLVLISLEIPVCPTFGGSRKLWFISKCLIHATSASTAGWGVKLVLQSHSREVLVPGREYYANEDRLRLVLRWLLFLMNPNSYSLTIFRQWIMKMK